MALALAVVMMVGNVVIAIVRRGAGVRLATTERLAKAASASTATHTAEIAKLKDDLLEHEHRINDLDERISVTDPNLKPRDERLSRLEASIAEEKAARDARHQRQATEDLKLVATLTRLETNLANLKERVEEASSNGSRRRN